MSRHCRSSLLTWMFCFAGCAGGPVGAGVKLPPSPERTPVSREYSQRERIFGEAVAQHLQLEPGMWLGVWSDERGTGLPALVRAITPNTPGSDPGILYLFHGDTRRLAWIRAHKYRPFRLSHVRFTQAFPGERLIGEALFDRILVLEWRGETGRALLSAVRRAMTTSGTVGVLLKKGAPPGAELRRIARAVGLEWTAESDVGGGAVLHLFSRNR